MFEAHKPGNYHVVKNKYDDRKFETYIAIATTTMLSQTAYQNSRLMDRMISTLRKVRITMTRGTFVYSSPVKNLVFHEYGNW